MTPYELLTGKMLAGTQQQMVAKIRDLIAQDRTLHVACLNPHSYVMAMEIPSYREALAKSDVLVPDGVGAVMVANRLSATERCRLTGFDVLSLAAEGELLNADATHFFLGSTPDVLASLEHQFKLKFPLATFAGSFSPPYRQHFDETDIRQMAAEVNKKRPDYLWIGLSAPKQEQVAEELRAQVDVRVIGSIGAAFDFLAGTVSRGPDWSGRLGLEWAFRLLQQPRRLWRRTFVSLPRFLVDVLKESRKRRC